MIKDSKSNIKKKVIEFLVKRSTLSIIFLYDIISTIVILAAHPIIPTLFNYAPNNEEVSVKLGTSNNGQYILIWLLTIIIGSIVLLIFFKGIDNWRRLDPNKSDDLKEIEAIRKKCLNLPSGIFLLQILVLIVPLSMLLFIVATLNNITYLAPTKIILIVSALITLAAVITHIFAKEIFKRILIETYINQGKEGIRISLRKKIFLQIMPMLIIASLFTTFIGYSRLVEEKGDLIYSNLKIQLKDKVSGIGNIKDADTALNIIKNVNMGDTKFYYFIKSPDGSIKTSKKVLLGGYLTYYIDNPYNGDRLYDINGEVQGIVSQINSSNGIWKLGIVFNVTSDNALNFFIGGFLIILILNIFVLYYFSKSLTVDITQVADSLASIAAGDNVNLDNKIPVTSNDEIGDLVVAFNKILDKEKEYIKDLKEKHEILMEQERLASLGQLIGGIAHNMRTPIMSLSGAIEGLKDLAIEYNDSVYDPEVTKENHLEIAKEMLEWLEKMKPHCSYMSDMITAIRGQTLNASSDLLINFSLDDLSKRVKILMSHELKKDHCNLKMEFNADTNIQISGELSVLVQILNNLIINAIESYDGQGGEIDLKVKVENKRVVISVKDYGKGIPVNVKMKIFKEMITTKGKNGTGLGLYMSYSNLKARFRGKMWLQSEEGKGSEFFISIPVKE